MFEVLWNLSGRVVQDGVNARPGRDDPLVHPAIARMDEREIADLPLRPRWPAAMTRGRSGRPAEC